MLRKHLSVLALSLAALAPMQIADAQDRGDRAGLEADGAVFAGDDSFHRLAIEPGITTVYLTGSGERGVELDLIVLDRNGDVITRDARDGDQGRVQITSRTRTFVMVQISNMGRIDSKYTLETVTAPLPRRGR
jgi:hypothetical protein